MKAMTTHVFALALAMATSLAWAEDVREVREAQADGRIEFSAITGDLTVVGHSAAEFILEGRLGDDVEDLTIEGDPSSWRIKLEPVEGNSDSSRNLQSSNLTLYVPNGSYLELGTVSGDLSVRDLSGPALEIKTISGGVELKSIQSSEIDVETVSGNVVADGVTGEENDYQSVSGNLDIRGAQGRIDIKSVSGHVTLEAETVNDFESETVSGDLKARLSPDPGASLSVSSHSGALELHVRLDDTPRIRAETHSGSIESDFGQVEEAGFGPGESLDVDGGANAAKIEAKSFSGSVTIRRAD